MNRARIRALLAKEFLDLARNRTALVPVIIVTAVALLLPFGITVAIPALTGHGLGDDLGLVKVSTAVNAPESLSSDDPARLRRTLAEIAGTKK